jgi:hypothetical protein
MENEARNFERSKFQASAPNSKHGRVDILAWIKIPPGCAMAIAVQRYQDVGGRFRFYGMPCREFALTEAGWPIVANLLVLLVTLLCGDLTRGVGHLGTPL